MHHNNNHVNNNNTLSHQNNHQVNNGSSRFNNSNHHNNHHHQNNHYNNVVDPLQQQQQLQQQQENGEIFNMPSRMNAPPSLPISQRNNHNHQLQKDMSCGLISSGGGGGVGVGIGGINNSHSQHQLECIESNLLYQQTPSESSCTESSTDSSTEEEGWESGESDDYNINENFNALPLNSFLNLDDKNTSTTTTSTTYFSASIKNRNNDNNDNNNDNSNNNNNKNNNNNNNDNDNDSNNINNKCSSSLEMTNNERVIGDEISFNDMRSNHHQHHHDHDHSHLSYNSLNNVLTQQPQQQHDHHHQRQDNEMSLVPSTSTLLTNNYYQYQLNNKSNRKLFTKSNKKKYLKKRKVSVSGGDGLNVHDSTLIDLSLKITKKQKITVLPRQLSNDPQFRDAVIKNFKSNFNQTSPLPTPQQLTLSSSVDYYSSICDRQLSFGSPFKSPKELMQTFMSSSPLMKDGNVDVVNKGNKRHVESLIVVPKPIDSNDIGFNVEIREKVVPVVEDAAVVVVVASSTNNSNNNNNNNNIKAAPDSTISSFYNRFSSIFKRNATNINDTNQSGNTTESQLSNELMSSSTPTRALQTVAQRGNNVTHVTDFLANCISPTVPRSNRRNPFVFNEIRHEVQSINGINMNCVIDNKAIDNVKNSE